MSEYSYAIEILEKIISSTSSESEFIQNFQLFSSKKSFSFSPFKDRVELEFTDEFESIICEP